MPIHVLCPECSNSSISEVFQAYEKIKTAYFDKLIKKHGNIDLDKISLKADILPGIDFIFDALHIKNQCCRIHILGTTDYDL